MKIYLLKEYGSTDFNINIVVGVFSSEDKATKAAAKLPSSEHYEIEEWNLDDDSNVAYPDYKEYTTNPSDVGTRFRED